MIAPIWHPHARRELLDAADFYDERAEGLGSAFLDAIASAIERVSRHPESGHRVRGETRRQLTRTFPYGVIYQLVPSTSSPAKVLYILAIAHQSRKPLYWAERLRRVKQP